MAILEPRTSNKSPSAGALTAEAKARQDRLYASNPRYETVIIGTGMAAFTVGALEFSFCAQIHYIWGCGEGDRVWRFPAETQSE